MSRLTEIIKQIPLDEMMGDADMKENSNNGIDIISSSTYEEKDIRHRSGGMVGRRTGAVVAAAACAIAAVGGAFAYYRVSRSDIDVKAPDISTVSTVSTAADSTAADSTAADSTAADSTAADSTAADSTAADDTAAHTEAYQQNMELYRSFYERIDADISLVENYIYPLEEPAVRREIYDGITFGMIGCRQVGTFIRVDFAVYSPDDRHEFSLEAAECYDLRLTKDDGTFITGVPINTMRCGGSKYGFFSIAFPQYQQNENGDTVFLTDYEHLVFSAGKLGFRAAADYDGAEWEVCSSDYSQEFTSGAVGCYDHSITANVTSQFRFFNDSERVDDLTIKEINYSAAGAAVVFTIDNTDDDYRQQVFERLTAMSSYLNLYVPLQSFGCLANDDGKLRWLMSSSGTDYSIMIDKLDDDWNFIASREFFDDPIDLDEVTGFLFGENNTPVPISEEGVADTEDTEQQPLSFDALDIELLNVKKRFADDSTTPVNAEAFITIGGLPQDTQIDLSKTVTVTDEYGNVLPFKPLTVPSGTDGGSVTAGIDISLDGASAAPSTLTIEINGLMDITSKEIAAGTKKLSIELQPTNAPAASDTAEE